MSTHDFSIANQAAFAARDDINKALQALASNSSSATAPANPFEKMWWYDTSNNILKSYKGSGAWINVGRFNQTSNEFEILDDTKVVTTSGTQVGILGDQATATWDLGTGTTESLVSPAKIASAIDALSFQDVDLSAQGKVKLGFGLEVIWGYFTTTADGDQTHNFHTAFTNNCWGMAMGAAKTAGTEGFGGNTYCAVQVLSTTQFQSNRPDSIQGNNAQFYYIAWGN